MPTPTYTPLANITLGSAAATVTFTSLTSHRDYIVVCTGTSASASNWAIRLNSDTGSNYTMVYMYGAGSGSYGSGTDATTSALGGGIGTSTISQSVFQIMDGSASDKHKTILNRTDRTDDATYAWANRWANTAAVTSIQVRCANGANFNTGSTFALYGVAA
jgi:hypothetical protein